MAATAPRQKPIGTAIVGLSANAITSWAAQAHLPCLLCTHGLARFTIKALLDSSEEAAQAAIKEYSLDPSTTKAYGSAEDLAKDPEVELVIINTRVDKHLESAIPAISAGKDVYVEWPIAANLHDIRKMAQAARDSLSSKVAVGLQGRWAAPVLRVKQQLQSGQCGKLLSCDVRAFGGTMDRAVLPAGLKYFTQKEVGGNLVTIGFGHVIDYVQSVVGELDATTTSARFQIQRPRIPIRDPSSPKVVEEIDSDVPDHLSLHGGLSPSAYVAENATLTAYFRRGQPFPGQPALTISLTCEKAEVVLTAPSGISLQANAYDEPVSIRTHVFATDEVIDVPWEWEANQLDVPTRARSVQRCLYAFADGDENGWASINDAVLRAEQIDAWLSLHVVQ